MGWQGAVTCRSDGRRNSMLPATGAGDDRVGRPVNCEGVAHVEPVRIVIFAQRPCAPKTNSKPISAMTTP